MCSTAKTGDIEKKKERESRELYSISIQPCGHNTRLTKQTTTKPKSARSLLICFFFFQKFLIKFLVKFFLNIANVHKIKKTSKTKKNVAEM